MAVKAEDKGTPPLSSQRTFTIFIEDVDESPPTFDELEGQYEINENANENVNNMIPEANDADGPDIKIFYLIHGLLFFLMFLFVIDAFVRLYSDSN